MSEATNELVVLNNEAITTAPVENGNWGDDEDEPAPRAEYLQIKQPSTENPVADALPNGSFFNAQGDTWENNVIEMVIFKAEPGRGWKPSAPLFVKGEKFLCRSNDRKTPITGEGLVPQAKSCETCAKASWKNYNKSTKTGKPLCDTSFYIYGLDRKTDLPFIYTSTRASTPACEAMKEAMRKMSKKELDEKGYRPSTFEFVVTATTVKEGKNYQIKFASIARLKPEAAAKYKSLYQAMLESYSKTDEAEESTESGYYDASSDTGVVLDADEPAVAI